MENDVLRERPGASFLMEIQIMTSQVSVPGIIRGNGQTASCAVTAYDLKTVPGAADSNYARMEIHNVSPILPEGDYVLTFNGKTIPVLYRGGRWLQR
jgi:hypothetical protein